MHDTVEQKEEGETPKLCKTHGRRKNGRQRLHWYITHPTLTNLLDERVRGEEGVVLLGELLDEVLVLVELLQVLHRHAVEPDLLGLEMERKQKKEAKKTGRGRDKSGLEMP